MGFKHWGIMQDQIEHDMASAAIQELRSCSASELLNSRSFLVCPKLVGVVLKWELQKPP